MKITTSQITKLAISGLQNMDPIAVMVEDFSPGAGKVTITSFGDAWSRGWMSMGEQHTMRSFFRSCDTPYLIGKFNGSLRKEIDDQDDETLGVFLKKEIIKQRRERDRSKNEARELWDDSDWVSYEERRELCEQLFGDEWWESLPKIPNPEYLHLEKIINTVKEAFALEESEASKAARYGDIVSDGGMDPRSSGVAA